MKLKLFFLSILALLSLVGYKTYRDTAALKSIDSYESCIVAKGSIIQESYPATCITRLGTRFTQPITSQKYQEYRSEKYNYEFKYLANSSPYDYSLREYESYERHDFGSCVSIYVGKEGFELYQVTENIPFKYLREISKFSIGQTKNYTARLANNLPVKFVAQRKSDENISTYLWTSIKNVGNAANPDFGPYDSTYYLYHSKKLYLINISDNSRCQDYDLILSTFKFTN